MRCAILLGQARQRQEQTIWIHSAKQLFPPFPHGKQEICAANTTDTFRHIHIHCQQDGVPPTQRRWQVDSKSAKSAPTELLGSSAGRFEMISATQASPCLHGCLWWFFPSSAPTAMESKHLTAKPSAYTLEDLVNIWLCFCLNVILVPTERILPWHQII